MHINDAFINLMINLVKKCNKKIMEIYQRDFTVEFKDDKSPLTKADLECNQIICSFLQEKYPEILIISEENKQITYADRKNHQLCWLVDPIDGTKEFINKTGEFTVNIGLCKNGVPIFGIVSVPTTGIIYYGGPMGSFKIDNNSKIQLKIPKKNLMKKKIKIAVSRSHMNSATAEFVKQFDSPELISAGSSLKLLMVAEASVDIYPRLGPTSEWDTCAAHAVVKYAKGKVLAYKEAPLLELTKEITYNKGNILNPFFIVV